MFSATLGFLALLLTSTSTSAQIERAYIDSFVELRGMEYGMSQERIEFVQDVIKCESNYKKNSLGDKGKAYSYFQFWRRTFDNFKTIYGHTWLSYDEPADHLELGMWAFSTGKLDKHWTCASK